jgi:ADP-ribose pyrophosphatase YjhB (NUDIX family)
VTDEGYDGQTGAPSPPRFCLRCGGALAAHPIAAEGRERLLCAVCGRIQYQNPIVVASVVLERGDETFLLRRARPPGAGTWVFPGGFVELGETVAEAAVREAREEAGVEVNLGPLLGVYDRPGPGVVLIVYRATIARGVPAAGHEATAAAWYAAQAIPWADLAFDTTAQALRDWVRVRR